MSNRWLALLLASSALTFVSGCSDADEPPPPPLRFAEIATTYEGATCAVTTDGILYCWGQNWYSQLTGAAGLGCAFHGGPCITRPVRADAPPGLHGLTGGIGYFCGLLPDGTPVCWGGITLGTDVVEHLGSTPTPLPGGFRLVQIDAGYGHICGVTVAGDGVCWGDDFGGVRGTMSSSFGGGGTLDPTMVDGGLRYRAINAGHFSTCGVTEDARAYCWGRAYPGLIGNPAAELRTDCGLSFGPCAPVPVPVAGDLTFAEVTVGFEHVCGRTGAGDLACWGSNEGIFGAENPALTTCTLWGSEAPCATTPMIVVPGPRVAHVASAAGSTCYLDLSGVATCLGAKAPEGLGSWPGLPAASFPGHSFTAIAPSGQHTCGLDRDGLAWCWGLNDVGQLGDGTTRDSPQPVAVSGPANP